MNRKAFLTAASFAGAMALNGAAGVSGEEDDNMRDYYELRVYQFETEEQKLGMEAFWRDTAIPALNRIGVGPVGVFQPEDGTHVIYVLLRYKSPSAYADTTSRLLANSTFRRNGAEFLDAPAEEPSYSRMESSLMAAFTGMPHIEVPATSKDRIIQLRIYESPGIVTGQKKIEMFNSAEIGIFRKTGLNPVFFGETLVGGSMPNLTYMLAFDSREQQKAAWDRFRTDPDWKKLSAMPEYADKKILCNITNIVLIPLNGSQI